MIKELVVLGSLMFLVCVGCWLIVPPILGSVSTVQASPPIQFGSITTVLLPLFLFVLVIFMAVLKARQKE